MNPKGPLTALLPTCLKAPNASCVAIFGIELLAPGNLIKIHIGSLERQHGDGSIEKLTKICIFYQIGGQSKREWDGRQTYFSRWLDLGEVLSMFSTEGVRSPE